MITAVKWIAIGLVTLVVLFVAIGFFLPSGYSVSRSVVIAADPAQVHRLVGDLEMWPEWTPWIDMDPTIQTTFGDQTTGIGASQSWTGESGSGELTFTQCDATDGVEYEMSFNEGQYESVGTIRYRATGHATEVTWSMDGDSGNNIIGRYFGLMMDSMVGPAFDSGLNKLKIKAETLLPLRPESAEAMEAAG